MYEYRKMTPAQKARVVTDRKANGYPWHATPHFGGQGAYMVSASCYEHRNVLCSSARLIEYADVLLRGIEEELGGAVRAWVVLPNHYHLVVHVDLRAFGRWIARIHNGMATQWNREDGTPGRKVWHRFSDRAIRNERHYRASVNYVHGNPVKHGYVEDSRDWPWSSLHEYLQTLGREQLAEWWRQYPVGSYGKGWDD